MKEALGGVAQPVIIYGKRSPSDENSYPLKLSLSDYLYTLTGFDIPPYDSIELTYRTEGNGIGEIGTVVYKMASNTVATLTLTYDANNKLSTITKT